MQFGWATAFNRGHTSTKKDPGESRKSEVDGGRRKKKARNLGPPTLRASGPWSRWSSWSRWFGQGGPSGPVGLVGPGPGGPVGPVGPVRVVRVKDPAATHQKNSRIPPSLIVLIMFPTAGCTLPIAR